jgi:predicted nucleic acid-binding protein
MKFVVDTNILFSYFKKDSFTKKLIQNPFSELISPSHALLELKKYSNLIMKKCNLSKNQFENNLKSLKKVIKFIPQKDYSKFLKEAEIISPDIKDKDFLVLCLKKEIILWSNDKLLKNQNKIKILTTEEIIDLFF